MITYTIKNREFATNDNENGLFIWDTTYKLWKQIKGTCEFTTRGIKNKKAKIQREVIDEN